MTVLLGASLGLLIVLLCMTGYVHYRPPEMSERGLHHFRRGLWLACLSLSALVGVSVLLPHVTWRGFTPNPVLVLLGAGGNMCNAVSFFYCVRELSGESLFAATLIAIAQLLWLCFGIAVLAAGF